MIDFNTLEEVAVPGERSPYGYIYFLFYRGRLVYIGSTSSLENRLHYHSITKIFDKVLIERVRRYNLRKREFELIRHYKPILNQEADNKPEKPYLIIEDCIFMHHEGMAFRIVNGAIVSDKREILGFVRGNDLCFLRGIHGAKVVVKYNFGSNVRKQERFAFEKRAYIFDQESFSIKFIDEPKEESKQLAIPPSKRSKEDRRKLLNEIRGD